MVDRCPTCKRKKTRSHQANARYWLLLHLVAERLKPQGHVYSAESWHTYFKTRYLGCNDVAMPNGKSQAIPRTTTELDTQEFSEYMLKVELWAGEHDVYLDEMEAA